MIDEKTILHYTISIEMVLKELREEKGIALKLGKHASQSYVNGDFEEMYGFTINMGRNESNPNFEIRTLFYLCDYFDISVTDFFKRVFSKKEKEISDFLKIKEKRRVKRK